MNNSPNSVTILPSHYHMLNIKKEKEIKIKINTSIEKFDEDSFDSQNVKNILNILF